MIMQATMERETVIRFELTHSCITGVCPNPCPARGAVERDDMDTVVSPEMLINNG